MSSGAGFRGEAELGMQCNYLNPERKMFASKSGSSRFSRFSFQIHSTPGVGRLPALHGAWGRPVAPGPEVQPASSTDSPGLFLFLFLFFIGCAESFAPKRCGEAKPFSRFLATTGCDKGRGPSSLPPSLCFSLVPSLSLDGPPTPAPATLSSLLLVPRVGRPRLAVTQAPLWALRASEYHSPHPPAPGPL